MDRQQIPRLTTVWERLRHFLTSWWQRPERREGPIDLHQMPVIGPEAQWIQPSFPIFPQVVEGRPIYRGIFVERFYACNPPMFGGRSYPVKVREWLHRVEYVLRACDIDRAEWVILAASLLTGNAQDFWETLTEREIAAHTWESFRIMMIQRFYSAPAQQPSQEPREARASSSRPRIPYAHARDFLLQAEAIIMGEDEGVVPFVARVEAEVFARNTLFELTDRDRCRILWGGLTEELQERAALQPDWTFPQFVRELRYWEGIMQAEREAVEQSEWLEREFPETHAEVQRQDAEATMNRRRQRPVPDDEEESAPVRRRYLYVAPAEDTAEEDSPIGSDEDPTEYPDDEEEEQNDYTSGVAHERISTPP